MRAVPGHPAVRRRSRPTPTPQQPYGPPQQPQQQSFGQPVRPQPAPPPQGPPGGPRGPGGQPPGGGPTPPAKQKRPVRRVLAVVAAVLAALLIWLVGVPVYAWSRIDRVDDAPSGDRPANQPGTTFLLVGSDSREGLTKAEKKKLGTGSTAGQRTDTIMILSIPPGGKPALISIPRDSYVPIPGNGTNKINAAYAFGGPELLVETVEQNTGLRIDALHRDRLRRLRQRDRRPRRDRDVPAQGDQGQGLAPEPEEGLPDADGHQRARLRPDAQGRSARRPRTGRTPAADAGRDRQEVGLAADRAQPGALLAACRPRPPMRSASARTPPSSR